MWKSNNPYIFGVCGVKNTGKTTYMEKLIKALKGQGLTVAAIKHDGHDFEGDIAGTDSRRMYDAGADATAVFSQDQLLIHERRKASLEELCAYFTDYDIVLVEGMKELPIDKVEIVRRGNSSTPVSNPEGRMGIVTDIEESETALTFGNETIYPLNDLQGLVCDVLHRLT